MTNLVLHGLTKTYDGSKNILDGIDLEVSAGELVSLLGPSGCGKSTALRIIAGLIMPSSGRVLVAGKDITALPAYARKMGLVFQSYALFPHLTVARNIAFGLEMRGVAKREIDQRVEEALAVVRLEALGSRMPRQLSGGQQQRVALARALVIRPDLLLLDEPLSNLDAKLRDDMRAEIRDLQLRLGITTVFVTHDQGEALTMSDRVAVMRGGHVLQCASPREIFEQPATAEVAAFIGRVNRLDGRVSSDRGDGSLVTVDCLGDIVVPRRLSAGERAIVMIRPHKMRVAKAGTPAASGANRVTGCVDKVVYAGESAQVWVRAGKQLLQIETPSHLRDWQAVSVGETIAVDWSVDDGLAYAAEGASRDDVRR